ncbi:unnamed protein product [Adineta steineri]|uniref:Uncharacterized protein n=1 Tax=Adineta steineri TaxID=433720 RepID=A0A818U5X0_9BILA|nr:unnamed protein product [Adineta steineri]
MSSLRRTHSNTRNRTSQKISRLHLRHLHIHSHKKPTQDAIRPQISGSSEGTQSSKQLTREETEHRNLIQQYIFSKLEDYANKPRIWQFTHSNHIKRRILDKSGHISRLYSVPVDFVRESINQFFNDADKHISQLRRLTESSSHALKDPNILFQKGKKDNNQWRSLQLKRAKEIFPDINNEDYTDSERLHKYHKYILETLTPKADKENTNCTAQNREQPFDLNHAYEQAENKGKDYLSHMLQSYHDRTIPDLAIIQEMVNHGIQQMKIAPTSEEFDDANSFLAKISVLHAGKKAYETGLRNMGDDFMLLRFGKVFGPNALPTTASTNDQFIYLVHMFMKSVSSLMIIAKITDKDNKENPSGVINLITNIFSSEPSSSVYKLRDELFSPNTNVDQWTWLLEKWRDALRTFPMMLTQVGAFGRLIRTTIGIGIARLFNFSETIINTKKMLDITYMNEQLFHALQTGFYFGVAYAIVDCVQDEIRNIEKLPAHHFAVLNTGRSQNDRLLSPAETIEKWLLIMEELLRGGEFNRKEIPKTPLTPLLLETFDSLVTLTKSINATSLAFDELALLLRSQRVDKKVPEEFYNDEELFLGKIEFKLSILRFVGCAVLKSHFTYTCTTFLGNIKSAREESERLWIMPFLGQLTDDCRDFYDDVTSNSVTSFTHYASFIGRQQQTNKHLLNPFYAFLYLCTDLYISSDRDAQTGAFLGRRIARTLKSIEISGGDSAIREFLHIFCQNNQSLHDYFWNDLRSHFPRVSDPEKSFFRIINKASTQYAKTNRKLETYVGDHLKQIEDALQIQSFSKIQKTIPISDRDEQLLLSAMNYSVTAGGKRLRPLMMLMVADLYNLNVKNVLPLACGIEYLHTSSLILDDLPAQDNSDLRRGRPTLHKATINNEIPVNLCEGRAQLAAVDLIAVSMSLINHDLVKNGFPAERVNHVISEISLSMHDLCVGQMMDLRAAHMGLDSNEEQVDELDRIAWLKTGKAIEVVLITPAVLAMSSSSTNQVIEIARIRELGRLMGILFQMRDDLLDVEGENIGKPAALDVKNHTVTYVSTLGAEGTRQRLKEYRRQTLNLVDEIWPVGAGTIKDVINHMVDRKN